MKYEFDEVQASLRWGEKCFMHSNHLLIKLFIDDQLLSQTVHNILTKCLWLKAEVLGDNNKHIENKQADNNY